MFEKKETTHVAVTTGTMIRAVLVCIGFFLIWYLRDLVLTIFTAIVIASFVESALPYFKKIKINRIFAVVILYAVFLLSFAALFYLFAPLLVTEIYSFATFLSTYVPNNTLINYFQSDAFSGAKDIVANLPRNLSLPALLSVSKAFTANVSSGLFQTLSVAFGSIFNVFLILLISFYLSIQEKGIESFLRIVLPIRYEEYVVDLWGRSRRKIALWVKGQMLLGLLITVLIYLMLSLLGVKYALLLAIISGIMELVPYGVLVALIPAAAFAYLSDGISRAIMVVLAYFIMHEFEVFLFAPLIIKKVVGLSPIVIILAAAMGFELGGFWGVLLAIPAAVVFVELTNDIEKHKVLLKEKNEQK